MMTSTRTRLFAGAAFAFSACLGLAPLSTIAAPHAPRTIAAPEDERAPLFTVTADPALIKRYSGRVYILAAPPGRGEPRRGPGWFSMNPFLAMDVTDWDVTTPLELHAGDVLSYPSAVDALPAGTFAVQAVLRVNQDAASLSAEDNLYSDIVTGELDWSASKPVRLHISRAVQSPPPPSDPLIREVAYPSAMLSAFHGRDIMHRATVVLPEGYDADPERRYRTLYVIGGFGSSHRVSPRAVSGWRATPGADSIVRVILDPDCFGGHHVFADSASNGPRGAAFVEELIPALERDFRLIAHRNGRLLTGHSSGGWSSLWLQITQPDTFGGTWSTAPDPVDFSAFQLVDIYAEGANMFRTAEGERISLAHRGGESFWYADTFSAMETVLGEGGQLRSFEWVFSPRGDDGLPKKLYCRDSGAIDPAIADAWRAYDIRLILESRWEELAPKLAGRINIFMGDQDTFHLHHATIRLKEAMQRIGANITIEITPGADHGNVVTRELRERIVREVNEVE